MSPLVAARPGFKVGGQDVPALGTGLLGLSIEENTEGLYRCEAVFGNWGEAGGVPSFLYFDRKTLEFGKTFQVSVGTTTVFDGRILALEARFGEARPPEIVVLAEDRFQDLRMTRRTRTFANLSDSDVFRQIASDHGLTPSISVSGPTHAVLAQLNQSDLAFMRERARSIDAELWIDGSTLNAKSHSGRGGAPVRLNFGAELREFTVLADLAGQFTALAVNGWDVAAKSGLHSEVTDSVIGGELNGGTSGASVLNSALGQRKQAIAHLAPATGSEAQTAAEALFKRMARRFVRGRGMAASESGVRVGVCLDLQRLGPLFSGKYYVTESRLLFDLRTGLRAEFTAERAGLG